jgi:hypothetical protein
MPLISIPILKNQLTRNPSIKEDDKNDTTRQMLKKGRYGNEFYVQFCYEGF